MEAMPRLRWIRLGLSSHESATLQTITFSRKSWAEVGMAPSILQRAKLLVSPLLLTNVGQRVAVKAMQKGKITDYESFRNEITILMQLVQN